MLMTIYLMSTMIKELRKMLLYSAVCWYFSKPLRGISYRPSPRHLATSLVAGIMIALIAL
eukprot:scaffold1669_cov129-Cylindrotheca_fusiformis.AAC.8